MNLTPWRQRTSSPMTTFRTEMDDLWNRFFETNDGEKVFSRLPEAFRRPRLPALNVKEAEDVITVEVDLPGVEPKDVDVEVFGDELVISGERKWETKKEEKDYVRMESQFGSFRRALPLPSGLKTDPGDVDAEFKNGILKVRLKKVEPTPSKKIDVKAG